MFVRKPKKVLLHTLSIALALVIGIVTFTVLTSLFTSEFMRIISFTFAIGTTVGVYIAYLFGKLKDVLIHVIVVIFALAIAIGIYQLMFRLFTGIFQIGLMKLLLVLCTLTISAGMYTAYILGKLQNFLIHLLLAVFVLVTGKAIYKIFFFLFPSQIILVVFVIAIIVGMYISSLLLLYSKYRRIFIQILLVASILALGMGIFSILSSMRKPPVKKEAAMVAPLLNASVAETENARMFVAGFGTVAAKLRVQIAPEVSGRIVSTDENFVNGGFFRKDQTLVVIDARDYELAVQNAEAAVAQAKVVLDKETAEGRVARKEWLELNSNDQPASPLLLREPQIAQATAGLKAAEAQLARANLSLQRTKISLPFNGRVVSTSANLGQFVNPGQQIAMVYGTDVVEISVPIEDSKLEWINVPGPGSSGRTSAEVFADFAGSRHKWNGSVIRTGGHIDPSSRMVNVIVEVKEPFNTSNGRPPLTPGMFVSVRIKGKVLQNVIRLPRHTIHNGSFVWLDRNGRLSIQKVSVARFNSDYAYITDGITAGDTVITSPLDTVTDGMLIRTNLIVPQEKPNE